MSHILTYDISKATHVPWEVLSLVIWISAIMSTEMLSL